MSRQGSIEVQVGRVSTDGILVSLEEDEISLRQAQIIKQNTISNPNLCAGQ